MSEIMRPMSFEQLFKLDIDRVQREWNSIWRASSISCGQQVQPHNLRTRS